MPQIDPRTTRRAVRIGLILLTLIIVVTMLLAVIQPYLEYLWFAEDVRQPQIFTRAYQTRGLLFMPAFFLSWAILYFSLRKALKLSLIYLEGPTSPGQMMVSNAMHFIQDRGATLVKFAAPVFAFFSAQTFSNEWLTLLVAQHGRQFGKFDPIFGLDLGFFIFQLPWYRAMANYGFGLLFLVTILTVAAYAGLQGLAAIGKVEMSRPATRTHLSILIGATALVFALQIYLKTFEYGLVQNMQFTGAGYAASTALLMQRVVAGLIAVAAIAVLALMRSDKVYRFAALSAAVIAVVGILGVAVTPSLIQRLKVEPDKLAVEGPYAKRAIEMTRFAYSLDKIKAQDFPIQATPTPEALEDSKTTLDNMRLWDPEVVRQSIEVLQGLKPYYAFNDVDIDRYTIDGKKSMVMLSPRDIRLDGLSDNARTWINEKLQYTHGFGVAMSSVNSATSDGEPTFLIRDIPPTTPVDLKLDEPRIYFSDYRDLGGMPTDEYVLVNSNQAEFDYPGQDGEKTNRWSGTRGIAVGGFFRRLAMSIGLGDGNLLVSGNVTDKTRLLLHRGVLARCQKLFPFLKLDNDPYIVILNGKIYWILDAYTSTDRMPYSDIIGEGSNKLNYIRNSVKIAIDAYGGETTAYAMDEQEPILATYAAIYPGLFKPASEIPDGIREHFRYPEDLFNVQAQVLAQYHVTDSVTFLNNNDAWAMPKQLGANGDESYMPPYYVQMRLPQEPDDAFVLMLPFTPRAKANMSGWLAAHCDPDRYGELVLYNFSKGANVAGAEQMETTINSDPKVNAAKLQLQGGGQTDVIIGNLLVIPVGNSVMYAESLFPKSKSTGLQAMPRLKKVVLALNGKVEIGDTYAEALQNLYGNRNEDPPVKMPPDSDKPELTPPVGQAPTGVKQALDLLDKADAALKQGDWAKYGEFQKQARSKLRDLARQTN